VRSRADEKDLFVEEGVIIPSGDLSWTASRSSGPGGQHVNKVATKVTLRLDLDGTDALTHAQKSRLRRLSGRRLDADGGLLVSAESERSQRQNLALAREKLRLLVARALRRPKRRIATKPTRASKRRRLKEKRRTGDKKRSRARVRTDED
jgi:ribosome-associated protein